MIERLAIFGATGDLTARYLLPGLAALQAAGQLGDRFQLAGAGREEWATGDFRAWASAQLDRHGGQFPAAARQAVVSASSYHRADVADVPAVADVIAGDGPVAAYLALPPAVFPVAVSTLHEAGLPPGSRIVLEKPFGEDLDGAVELNRLLADLVPEPAVFPGRPLPGHDDGAERTRHPAGQPDARTHLEQHAYRRGGHRLGRIARPGGPGRLLRRRRRAQGHAAEPPAAAALPDRDGAADQPGRTRPARPQAGCAEVGAAADRFRRGAPHPPGPLSGRPDRRPPGPRLRGRGRRQPPARHRDLRRNGTRTGQLALAGNRLPAPDRKGNRARPQRGGRALPVRTAPAVRPQRGSTAQRAAVRARSGKPHPGPDRHRGSAAISIMAQQRNLLVGAGTVLDASQAERAAGAGARFIVSPGFDDEVVRRCQELSVPVLPGTATATEIQRARRAGLRVVKFFPAETLGGVTALDALSAPFPDMRFIPTGGIGPGNLRPYLARNVVLAIGGSWMVSRQLIAKRDWAEVTRLARDAARLAASCERSQAS